MDNNCMQQFLICGSKCQELCVRTNLFCGMPSFMESSWRAFEKNSRNFMHPAGPYFQVLHCCITVIY